MAISQFPAPSTGGLTNDFILNKNSTTNNSFSLGRAFEAGGYSLVVTGSTAFDIYLLDSNGSSVGYTNGTSIVATSAFESVSALGLGTADVVAFSYSGPSTNATGIGNDTGAGPFLVSVTPSDLPEIDDTTIVAGGNFASDVEIDFLSGTVVLPAKNVVVGSSTALVVTRPDALDANLDPWTMQAINPGVPAPTGSDANQIEVTAGAPVVWVTTSPLPITFAGSAYSTTLEATDADGSVTYSLAAGTFPGLSLNANTGVLSGTPTALATATVRALDAGGNFADRSFVLPVITATGGSVSVSGNYVVHVFNASGSFVNPDAITNAEYIILAGGGGSSTTTNNSPAAGGGGGGLQSSITGFQSGRNTSALAPVSFSPGTAVVTVGAGGGLSTNGSNSAIVGVGTAIGGGAGRADGGSGGGGARLGIAGQGQNGGNQNDPAGGGGGTFAQGQNAPSGNQAGNGGAGTHNFLDQRGWGAGGGSGNRFDPASSGGGSSGTNQTSYAGSGGFMGVSTQTGGVANFGGGAGGAAGGTQAANGGGSGKVVIRYEVA